MAAARFFAKVYDNSGAVFKRVLGADIQLSVPNIVREVNKPVSEIQLELALPWDNFGYPTEIAEGFFIRVWAVNEANPTGLLVYQGTIEEIMGSFAVGKDSVSLRLRPIDALISASLWRKSGSYTFTYSSADVDTVFSDAIDDLNSIYGSHFSKNLGNPGLSITQEFTRQTHLSIMQAVAANLPDGWYWRVNADGEVDLGQFNDSTPDHTLTLGLHVDSIQATKSIINTKNKILLAWGAGPTEFTAEDVPSQVLYGRRMSVITDSGIQDLTTATARANGELARKKNPFTKTMLVVNANYPIETIKPGHTVRVVNKTLNTSQMLDGIYRILRVEYNGLLATLHLDDIINNFGTEFGRSVGN